MFFPSLALVVASVTNNLICFAASALLLARFLTSLATTANPFPASPAVAASTAAFNDNIFVWNAILSIIDIASFIAITLAFISYKQSEVILAKTPPKLHDLTKKKKKKERTTGKGRSP